jgi:hypothetical protein
MHWTKNVTFHCLVGEEHVSNTYNNAFVIVSLKP